MEPIFPIIILNARPGAGKSELVRYLMSVPREERVERFRIGNIEVLDDFPMLWTWFEEDDLLEEIFNLPRLHSSEDRYFLKKEYWHLLIRRLNLEYEKCCRDAGVGHTAIIEFSRGTESGGYSGAYHHLSDKILDLAVSLYIQVSFEESLRKNRVRFNPERPYSVLQHGLEDEKMWKLYHEDDWKEFSKKDPAYLHVRDKKVPYHVFENEDDVTTKGGEALAKRLEASLQELWKTWTLDHELV
jgi:hypothetical protein